MIVGTAIAVRVVIAGIIDTIVGSIVGVIKAGRTDYETAIGVTFRAIVRSIGYVFGGVNGGGMKSRNGPLCIGLVLENNKAVSSLGRGGDLRCYRGIVGIGRNRVAGMEIGTGRMRLHHTIHHGSKSHENAIQDVFSYHHIILS